MPPLQRGSATTGEGGGTFRRTTEFLQPAGRSSLEQLDSRESSRTQEDKNA